MPAELVIIALLISMVIGRPPDKTSLLPGQIRVLAAAVEDTDKSLRELVSDEFYPFLEEAGEKLVIVDFYTDW